MARYASPYGNRMAVFESEREKRRRRRASRETLPPVRYGETRDTDLALIDKVAESAAAISAACFAHSAKQITIGVPPEPAASGEGKGHAAEHGCTAAPAWLSPPNIPSLRTCATSASKSTLSDSSR
jgi:hypothetical protein